MATSRDDEMVPNLARAVPTKATVPAPPAAAACLQASLLLRRRIHRHPGAGVDDEQALLAVCQLLDALSRGLAASPAAASGGIERAALRLADQLHRADSTRADSTRADSSRVPARPRT